MKFTAPINPPNTKITTPFDNPKEKGSLKYRIGRSDVFVMYGSITYLRDIMYTDLLLSEQFQIARKLNIPSILLIDRSMKFSYRKSLKETIRGSGLNLIKEIEYDFKDKKKVKEVEQMITNIIKEFMEGHDHAFRWC